jgi:CSLREA domain-containing protein
MLFRYSALRISSRSGKTAITLLALGVISWLTFPNSVWNQIQPLAWAASFTVNTLADTSDAAPGNGICADAGGMCSLRAAIQEANSLGGDDTITFSVTGTISLTGVLPSLASNITISGPGSGSLTVRRDTGGDYRIFTINSGRTVNLSGLTVTNGRTPDGTSSTTSSGGSSAVGGGINNAGILTLRDVVVTANGTGNGGASGGSATGGSSGFGGGIASDGSLTMIDVVVSNNTTGNGAVGFTAGTSGSGAGLYFHGNTLTMTNVVISGNTVGSYGVSNGGGLGGDSGSGGGVYALKGILTLSRVTVTGNAAGNGAIGGSGGGLFIWADATTTMVDCSIVNNSSGQGSNYVFAEGGSGGGLVNYGTTRMLGCLVSGNTTKGAGSPLGGGIYNANTLNMTNCTVSGNTADPNGGRGGGIYNRANALTLTNVTITANKAYTCCNFENGQGIHNEGGANVRNTIIAENNPGVVPGGGGTPVPDVTGAFNSQGHNIVGRAMSGTNGDNGDQNGFAHGVNGDQVGTTTAPINPQLGALANNGGPTLTHAPLAESPALDAGNNSLAIDASNNPLATDQRGAGRFADSPDAGSTVTVDIGAFEFHQILENVQDRTTNEDTPISVSFAIGDRGLEATTPTVTSNNQALIPAANLLLTGTGSVRTLLITPIANLSGVAQITLSVTYTDSVSSGASPPQFVVEDTFLVTVNPVNDVPTFTLGPDQAVDPDVVFANQTVLEDAGPQSIANWATGISAGPNESEQTLTFQVTANTNPILFSAGPAISDTGTLTFTPAANSSGSALITVVLKDNGGTSNGGQDTSAAKTFQITVIPINDVPTFTKGANQTVNEDAGFQFVSNWATGISAGPNESQSVFFQVIANTNPTLFSSAPSVNSLGTLSYSPASNASGSATITIVLKDSGGTTNGGQDTSASQTFIINVTAVNDAPINSVPFSQIINQNTPRVFSPANFNTITISDVDAGTDAVRITLSATQGTLTLGSTAGVGLESGDGSDDVTVTFTGAITAINTALNGLTFKPNTNFSGSASIQVTTDDLGHNGSGGAKTDTDTVAITVRAAGTIQFVNATYEVHENFGVATITVSRTGGSSGAGSVNYATSNGTALGGPTCGSAGADYRSASGTLSWANVDSSTKSFDVLLCGDSQNEANETINLVLSSPTGTVTLGTTISATLTILNDDAPFLLMVENTQRAVAFDLVTQMTEPFSLTSLHNLSTDKRGRISLFVWRLGLLFGDTAANLTVLAEDDQGGVYPLPVESVVTLAGLPDMTQVVVRLPDNVIGAPRDLGISVSLRGPGSNKAFIQVSAP